jgi:hypothetical protein
LTESTLYIGQEFIGFKKPYKANFLSDREFNVRVNSTYSDIQEKEMGVPQRSILSVTLFSIKINSLAKISNDNIEDTILIGELYNFNSGSG